MRGVSTNQKVGKKWMELSQKQKKCKLQGYYHAENEGFYEILHETYLNSA